MLSRVRSGIRLRIRKPSSRRSPVVYGDAARGKRNREINLRSGDAEHLPCAREEMERSIPERLAKVASAYPSALAIATRETRVSYAELARRSNALAAEIVRRSADSRTPVAVLADDRVAMVTAMIATWQAH